MLSGNQVNLSATYPRVDISFMRTNGEWDFKAGKTETKFTVYAGWDPYPSIVFNLYLKVSEIITARVCGIVMFSYCLCVCACLSVQAITFECLDMEVFSYGVIF